MLRDRASRTLTYNDEQFHILEKIKMGETVKVIEDLLNKVGEAFGLWRGNSLFKKSNLLSQVKLGPIVYIFTKLPAEIKYESVIVIVLIVRNYCQMLS